MPNPTPSAAAPRTDDPFARLVDRDLDRVWRFLRSLVRDPDLARDLCHDTFLRLRRALAEGRVRRLEEGLPTTGYVFAAARRAAYDHGRRRRDVVPLDAVADARADGNPHGDMERGQLGQALDAALIALDDDHRAVFVLSELEGLRYEEIADACDACRALRDDRRTERERWRAAWRETAPADLRHELLAAAPPAPSRRRNAARWLPWAAAAVLALVLLPRLRPDATERAAPFREPCNLVVEEAVGPERTLALPGGLL